MSNSYPRTLERNLGAVVRVPLLHNNELAHHTNTPTLRYSTYEPSWDVFSPGPLPVCLQWCRDVIASLDIEEDPWVINGRKKLQELDRHKTSTENFERNLANVIAKKATFTLKSLRRLETTACEMHWSLGEWAVERYLQMATTQVSFSSRRDTWSDKELEYLLSVVSRIRSGFPPSTFDISDAISPKVRQLLKTLLDEYTECENSGTPFVGLLFATRRDVVIMLERILSTHPATKDIFRCGCLIGSSTNAKRETLFDLDQRRNANLELEQQMILSKFRGLEINLLIATSVAEEGLDIPACGAVIRFDAPANLRSWIQSQGRARRQRSTYSILIDQNFPDPSHSYQSLKAQMEEQCRKEREQLQLIARASEMEGDAGSEDSLKFVNEKTG
jgi:endoribonuclease Dicer